MCNGRRTHLGVSDVGGKAGAPVTPDHATLIPANALVGMLKKVGEASWLKNWLAR